MNSAGNKIITLQKLSRITARLKRNGRKIVHCHGVFDLIHPGHIYHFRSAKKYGDVLVVTITADKFVKKGPGRPTFNEDLRAEFLAALSDIDYVAIARFDSAIEVIKFIQPDFYVKGPDYKHRKPNPKLPRKLGVEQATVEKFGGKLVYTDDEIIFSSSHLLNEHFDTYPETTKEYLTTLRKTYSAEQIIEQLLNLKSKKILVIGDAIIDEYQYTLPLGKSSKEPVLVHIYKDKDIFAGGTLATANHLAALSERISLVTLLGKTNSFEKFIKSHLRPQITPHFFYEPDSQTIVDRRFLDQFTRQKLYQVRYMQDASITGNIEVKIARLLKKLLSDIDIVVVNDYGHGLLTPKLIRLICRQTKFLALNVQANSANFGFNVITKYSRADFICIDEQEVRLATHDKYTEITLLAKKIARTMHTRDLIVTRGPYGAVCISKNNGIITSPALSKNIVDRVGAGDAFFSIAAAAATEMDPKLVAFLGNVAGALKLQTVGNKSPIDFKEMTKFITRLLK